MSRRLTTEEREQLWDDYHNKRGIYAETEQKSFKPVLYVDTQQATLNTKEPIDFKQLEREVTRKAIALIAAFIVALYLLSKLFS